MNKENDDLDLLHKKIDLKQFSEMQAEITKGQLQEHLNTEFEKQKRAIDKRNVIIGTIIVLFIGGNVLGWLRLIDTTKQRVNKALNDEINNIRDTIEVRLTREFETPRITKLIETKAQEYTEKNARNYIETQVTNKIEPFVTKINSSLVKSDNLIKETNDAIIKANKQLEDLTFYNNITNLQAEALSGSRKAYNKLYRIYGSNTVNTVFVENAIRTIDRYFENTYENLFAYPGLVSDKPNDKVTTKYLFESLNQNPSTLSLTLKLSIIGEILNRPDNEIFESSYAILKTSESLEACAITTSILRKKFGTKATFMDFDGWIKVIEKDTKK